MKILFSSFLVMFLYSFNAQTCTLHKSISNKNFAIYVPQQSLKANKHNTFSVSVKAPTKGAHIKKSGLIRCNNWIPGGASVKEIQIKSISNLPKGLSWTTSFSNNRLLGGAKGCVFLKGIPKQKGRFKLDVKATGKGRFLGVTKTIDCEISGITIEVE